MGLFGSILIFRKHYNHTLIIVNYTYFLCGREMKNEKKVINILILEDQQIIWGKPYAHII